MLELDDAIPTSPEASNRHGPMSDTTVNTKSKSTNVCWPDKDMQDPRCRRRGVIRMLVVFLLLALLVREDANLALAIIIIVVPVTLQILNLSHDIPSHKIVQYWSTRYLYVGYGLQTCRLLWGTLCFTLCRSSV